MDWMPTSAQSLCLPPTYQVLPGVGTHQDGAQAGDDSLGGQDGNASGQFCLMAAAVALPSRICAVDCVIPSALSGG